MERINQFSFYQLGQTLKDLSKHKGDLKPFDCFIDSWSARESVRGLIAGKPIPLGVSKQAAIELETALSSIHAQYFETTNSDGKIGMKFPAEGDEPIPQWRWSPIISALARFETVFAAEMAETATYFVPRRGIFSTPALVDYADESFPAHLAAILPDKTKEEWRSAGRCLAFNLLSASGFHVARAVEGVLELYYQTFCGKEDETLKTWGNYHEKLSKKLGCDAAISPVPSKKVLDELLQMKDDYRNPIMHPRVVLRDSDARMLWNNGESLIIAMAEELQEISRSQGGVQRGLALVAPEGTAQ